MNKRKPTAQLGASLIVMSSLFYASYGIWTKLMGNFFGGYTASALRSVVVLMILVPIAWVLRRLSPLEARRNWRYLAGLLVSSLFIWGPLYYAILHAGVGISLAINYSGIVLGMFFFGRLFAGERFTRDKLLSTVLGLTGLWLVFSPTFSTVGWLALGAAALSGVATASNMVITKQMPYNATQSAVLLWGASVIANVVMALVLTEAQPAIGWHIQWAYLVLFAVASVVASWSFIAGIKLVEAGAAGILGLLEIVFGVIFGVVLFNEQIGPVVMLGILIIIASAAVPYLKAMIKPAPVQ